MNEMRIIIYTDESYQRTVLENVQPRIYKWWFQLRVLISLGELECLPFSDHRFLITWNPPRLGFHLNRHFLIVQLSFDQFDIVYEVINLFFILRMYSKNSSVIIFKPKTEKILNNNVIIP